MKKIAFFVILLPLTLILVNIASANQYRGGPGGGYAMGEYTGRLDGTGAEPRSQQAEGTSQYHGGPGSGYAMGEYAGPIDSGKKQPEGRKGGLRNTISGFFKGRSR